MLGGAALTIAGAISMPSTRASLAQVGLVSSEWDYRSVKELVQALRTRRISSAELVERMIARIEALDQQINAVVVRDFYRARETAKAADAALARGEQRPLLGVPMTVKEAFNVAGLPTIWGIPRFKDFVPKEDAVIVSRVKSAGAIILGKTNVPLLLGEMQSYNEIYGTTNNPWDLARSPGGSSGGSAAALAAGFGPLSLGSDQGGSIRGPAHFCGVYGHKPTLGLVPDRGQTLPAVPPLPGDSDLAVIGPMARTAGDLALALDVVAGPDEARAGIGYRLALPPARHDNLGDFRVLVVDSHPLVPTADAVRVAIGRLSERLGRVGVKVAHASPLLPDLANSARVFMRLLFSLRGANLPPGDYEEARRTADALAPNDNSLVAERIRGTVMSHRDWSAVDAARTRLRQQWSVLFREWDVVVCPVAPTPAFRHDHSQPLEARHIDIDGKEYPYRDTYLVWADPANSSGHPATAAPIDRSQTGLPIGVQIIGPYLEDRAPLRCCAS